LRTQLNAQKTNAQQLANIASFLPFGDFSCVYKYLNGSFNSYLVGVKGKISIKWQQNFACFVCLFA